MSALQELYELACELAREKDTCERAEFEGTEMWNDDDLEFDLAEIKRLTIKVIGEQK